MRQRSVGFFGGAAALFGGVGWVATTPRIWPRALVPVATALVLIAGLGYCGHRVATDIAHRFFGDGTVAGLAGVLLTLVAVVLAIVIAAALAQPLSGWALDGIVRAQERELGVAPAPAPPFFKAMLASLASGLLGLAVGVPIVSLLTILGWLFPPAVVVTVPLKVAIAGVLLAWDLLDYPLAARDFGVGARLKWCASHPGAVLGFGLAALAVFAVPGLGLVALPGGAAGAVRLVSRGEAPPGARSRAV
ncbi:MAG TPA: EI24 domain-containing protein [Polyangiaceae bacterium]|nr:EI24 domain-containing protein [Polyangiaceae bacterium]